MTWHSDSTTLVASATRVTGAARSKCYRARAGRWTRFASPSSAGGGLSSAICGGRVCVNYGAPSVPEQTAKCLDGAKSVGSSTPSTICVRRRTRCHGEVSQRPCETDAFICRCSILSDSGCQDTSSLRRPAFRLRSRGLARGRRGRHPGAG